MLASFRPLMAAALALPLALSACAEPEPLYVDQAWVRASGSPDRPSAAYFTVHGGPEPVELRAVQTDYALRSEIHESMSKDGMMHMEPISSVPIAAGEEVKFAPGGKHVMLFGMDNRAVQAGKIGLTFLFSNGDRIVVEAPVRRQGDEGRNYMSDDNAMADNSAGEHEGH